jgi:hypothetical protein
MIVHQQNPNVHAFVACAGGRMIRKGFRHFSAIVTAKPRSCEYSKSCSAFLATLRQRNGLKQWPGLKSEK